LIYLSKSIFLEAFRVLYCQYLQQVSLFSPWVIDINRKAKLRATFQITKLGHSTGLMVNKTSISAATLYLLTRLGCLMNRLILSFAGLSNNC
jgi:hypothetical protein